MPWLICSFISNQFLAHSWLIALMMEAVRTSEMFLNSYQSTWHYNPEDSHLCTHHHENLKANYNMATFYIHIIRRVVL
jgi:hypothetical protein